MSGSRSTVTLETFSEEETRAVGRRIGERLEAGMLVGVSGELGSGKTRLVQGMAAGLGIPIAEVTSPTFVLCHAYQGRLPLLHLDAYRLKSSQEFEELGVFEALENGAAAVVEWSDRVDAALPADRLQVFLVELGEQHRRIALEARGPISQILLAKW